MANLIHITNGKPEPAYGFTPPAASGRKSVVLAQLLMSLVLAASTIAAATVVSIGIARADVVADRIPVTEGGLFVIALLLGLVMLGIGGLSILPFGQNRHHRG